MSIARVVFARANTLASVAIRAAQSPTLAPWSHAAPIALDGTVVEALASRGRVVRTPWAEIVARSSVVEVLAVRVPDAVGWDAAVNEQAGKPYGYLDALGAWLGTRRLNTRGMYCSDAAAAALIASGIGLLAPSTRGVMPWALYRLMWAAGARPEARG